jgi:hypothetical protein
MRRGAGAPLTAALLLTVLAVPSCDYLDDRLKSCSDLQIDLVNSRQSIQGVSIAAEGEGAGPETYLEPGATRRTVECVRKGDRRTYRVFEGTSVVAQATCVVSRSREALDAVVARVEWLPGGLRCQNW